MGEVLYAGFPTAIVYANPGDKGGVRQLLWGDWLEVTGDEQDGWYPIRTRKVANGWIKASDTIPGRVLEIVFVDIGQGDGALVVTPDDQHLLVDAGQEDNMHRFLRWKYGGFDKPFDFAAAVITHSDQDHYLGFKDIFENPNVKVGTIYHNGLVERTGKDLLGPKIGGYLTDVVRDQARLTQLLSDPRARGEKRYPNLLFNALQSGRVGDIRAISSGDGHLPGFAPGENAAGLVIQVLGPVTDADSAGAPVMKWMSDEPKTKNGHSVVLRLLYGEVSILLGGRPQFAV
jgi:hypothetical protein